MATLLKVCPRNVIDIEPVNEKKDGLNAKK